MIIQDIKKQQYLKREQLILIITVAYGILLTLLYLYSFGLYGFRNIIKDKSPVQNPYLNKTKWFSTPYDRICFVILEGMGWRYAVQNKTINQDDDIFRNHFYAFNQQLQQTPDKAKLFRMKLNNPPHGLEKLFSLTTGSNWYNHELGPVFRSKVVQQDSLMYQIHNGGGLQMLQFGPQIWEEQFPDMGEHIQQTMDYDAVEQSMTTFRDGKWDFMFVYDTSLTDEIKRNSSENIKFQISQMSGTLDRMMNMADENTLIIVTSDYSFGKSGILNNEVQRGSCHTDPERCQSFLFAYNQKGFNQNFPTLQTKDSEILEESVVATTISAMIGIPPPFINQGSILLDFYRSDDPHIYLFQALENVYVNMKQVYDTAVVFHEVKGEIGAVHFQQMTDFVKDSENLFKEIYNNQMAIMRAISQQVGSEESVNQIKNAILQMQLTTRFMTKHLKVISGFSPLLTVSMNILLYIIPISVMIIYMLMNKQTGEVIKLLSGQNDEGKCNWCTSLISFFIFSQIIYASVVVWQRNIEIEIDEHFFKTSLAMYGTIAKPIFRSIQIYFVGILVKICISIKQKQFHSKKLLPLGALVLVFVNLIMSTVYYRTQFQYQNDEIDQDKWLSHERFFNNFFFYFLIPLGFFIVATFRVLQLILRFEKEFQNLIYIFGTLFAINYILLFVYELFINNEGVESIIEDVIVIVSLIQGLLQYITRNHTVISTQGHILLIIFNIIIPITGTQFSPTTLFIMMTIVINFVCLFYAMKSLEMLQSLQIYWFFGLLSIYYFLSLGYTFNISIFQTRNLQEWRGIFPIIRSMVIFVVIPLLLMVWNKALTVLKYENQLNLPNIIFIKLERSDDSFLKNTFKFGFFSYLNLLILTTTTSYYAYNFIEYYDEACLQMMYMFIFLIVFYVIITTLVALNVFQTLSTTETETAEKQQGAQNYYEIELN